MIELYIDTSSSYLYSALLKENQILLEVKKDYGQQLSQEALPAIITLFEQNQLTPQEVDRIYVVVGPGSFTGIRIGVTIAKTFAWTLQKEIIPVSALRAMDLSYQGEKEYQMPLIDARRGYVYGAIYEKEGKAIVEDSYLPLTSLEDKAKEYDKPVKISNSILFQKEAEPYDPDILKIVEYYRGAKPVNPHFVNPIYLKKTEAEEKIEKSGETEKNENSNPNEG